jgi:hypothetical protein
MRNARFIELDVHAETVAVAGSGGEVRSLGTIRNRAESVARLVKKLASLSSCVCATRRGLRATHIRDFELVSGHLILRADLNQRLGRREQSFGSRKHDHLTLPERHL